MDPSTLMKLGMKRCLQKGAYPSWSLGLASKNLLISASHSSAGKSILVPVYESSLNCRKQKGSNTMALLSEDMVAAAPSFLLLLLLLLVLLLVPLPHRTLLDARPAAVNVCEETTRYGRTSRGLRRIATSHGLQAQHLES